jgi:hypothetical protein
MGHKNPPSQASKQVIAAARLARIKHWLYFILIAAHLNVLLASLKFSASIDEVTNYINIKWKARIN